MKNERHFDVLASLLERRAANARLLARHGVAWDTWIEFCTDVLLAEGPDEIEGRLLELVVEDGDDLCIGLYAESWTYDRATNTFCAAQAPETERG